MKKIGGSRYKKRWKNASGKKRKPPLDVRICPRCDFTNGYNSECCNGCGTVLQLLQQKAIIVSEAEGEEFLTKLFTALVEDAEKKKKTGFLLNKTGLGGKLLEIVKTRK